MVVIGWFSDVFEVHLNIFKLSNHLETIYYTRLGNIGLGFILGNVVRFLVLIGLLIGKIVTIKCDEDLKLEFYNFPNLKRKHWVFKNIYHMQKHLHTIGFTICLHILTSSLVDFKLSFGFSGVDNSGINLYRYMVFTSILLSETYILLYAIEYYRLVPHLERLFSLSLFMRVDMGLGI
jgi:hypothetical protein